MTFTMNESLFLEGFIWILLFPFHLGVCQGEGVFIWFILLSVYLPLLNSIFFSLGEPNNNSKDLGDDRTILNINSRKKVTQHVFRRNQTHRLMFLNDCLQWAHKSSVKKKKCRFEINTQTKSRIRPINTKNKLTVAIRAGGWVKWVKGRGDMGFQLWNE